jgi:cytochrome c biogenesis protein CcmG/thiol:disulfide interchange protein DsbE
MSEAAAPVRPPRSKARLLLVLLPLILFAGLAAIFYVRLGSDPEALPSLLVGKPVPAISLPPLGDGTPALSLADAKGRVTLVNFFSSWCLPCRQEHPVLRKLSLDPSIRIVGVNYKDPSEAAKRFLRELGNPFAAIGVDSDGRTGINWGVTGPPETFVVDANGIVRRRFTGPLTEEAVRQELAKLNRPG